ncbi:NADH-quinone oxidoreductase subunit M [Candidatus Pseudomonas adelgestsugas]|uniref:NADH-quinone oxidoreductase subunit M n=1 Tax=Candidatus Pseudomonas adelgestsugas TaxID=1302376 RepID=A0ABX5R8T4_9PSED|nr:NADH-quinone oxidoreductase subunit M [Candidatus Pseudomonas adelgestsugas]QAX81779.1 NADH-quinone oxidoreductase subunit M [Candidatus Pseudomonas adelgestsugas]
MILPWLILIPFIGGQLCWISAHFRATLPRWIALLTMSVELSLSLWLWVHSDYSFIPIPGADPAFVFEFKQIWIQRFGINMHLAIDGLSLLMILLTGLLGILSVLCAWKEIQRYIGFFYFNLMWILGSVVGVFLALDLFMFFFFWEMTLVPMYFLIALWGHDSSDGKKTRIYAATKFFIFTQTSGLIMLVAILGLVLVNFNNTGIITFNYVDLLKTKISLTTEYILMLGFFIAFAVKLPAVPFHSWMPDTHAQAPIAGSVDLAGILLKTAAYGLLRFALPLFPNASAKFAPIAMTMGLVGIFYGAFLAFAQTDIKRLIAFSSISHMGFVLIGIYSNNQIALQGAIIQMLAHGISTAALFILTGQLYERLHTFDMREMGGLWARITYLPAINLFFCAASLGLPGTGNFIGEFLILMGAFVRTPWISAIATSGLVLNAIYLLIMIHRIYFGYAKSDILLQGMDARELIMTLSLALLILYIGIYPQPFLDISATTIYGIQHRLSIAFSQLASVR